MKIAINSSSQEEYETHWAEYCEINNIPYKLINCLDSDVISQLEGCDGLMFHVNVGNKDRLIFGKQLLFTLQSGQKKVFPDFHNLWHYDDKVGQKYLFESIKAPLVPTYVFYEKKKALEWINSTSFPKVFKLRNGAGSTNVKLVKDINMAKVLINQAFGKGFKHQVNPWYYLREKWRLYRLDKSKFGGVKAAIKRLFHVPKSERKYGVEQGYVYFQDFIPNNTCDYRLQIVDGKCWGMIRKVREGDFRASGSNMIDFNPNNIPLDMVKLAFDMTKKLKMKSVGFDFVLDGEKKPLVVEMSYTFGIADGELNEGYWDETLKFYPGKFNPFGWMVDGLVREISESKKMNQ
jgi:glutathione synthase/RimK-type ligase-like ATP-grasp enzyme